MMVYIAAGAPLALVAWNEATPAFHVCEIENSEISVREQFSLPHVYYAGSHEGCGCGFQYGQYPEHEAEDRRLKRSSLESFSAYLARHIQQGPIEIYACWDGDQAAEPAHRRVLTPQSLLAEDFYFLEKELSRVAATT